MLCTFLCVNLSSAQLCWSYCPEFVADVFFHCIFVRIHWHSDQLTHENWILTRKPAVVLRCFTQYSPIESLGKILLHCDPFTKEGVVRAIWQGPKNVHFCEIQNSNGAILCDFMLFHFLISQASTRKYEKPSGSTSVVFNHWLWAFVVATWWSS